MAVNKQITIALFGRKVGNEEKELYTKLIGSLRSNNCRIIATRVLYEQLVAVGIENVEAVEPFDSALQSKAATIAFSVGGDGTFLETSKMVMNADIPVLGINNGRLGFLSEIAPSKIEQAIADIIAGNFKISHLDMLSLSHKGEAAPVDCALNEFSVSKCDNSSMLTIDAYVDGEYLTTYWADGLIVATPTGSTAYSLSVGGPIVCPSSPNFIITPIAPHNLSLRPLIVPNDATIDLKIEGRSPKVLTSLDGRTHLLDNNCELTITKTPIKIKVVQLNNHSFFTTLRNKLMWGADMRN